METQITVGTKIKSRTFNIVVTRVNEKSIWWRDERWDKRTKDTRYSVNTVNDVINKGYWTIH